MWVSVANGMLDIRRVEALNKILAGFVLTSSTSTIYHEKKIFWVVAGWWEGPEINWRPVPNLDQLSLGEFSYNSKGEKERFFSASH